MNMGIAARLEEYLLDIGVKPHKVKSTIAHVCGLTAQAVHQWYDGSTRSPSAENLAKFASHYHVSLMWIVTGKGPRDAAVTADAEALQALQIFQALPPNLRSAALQTLLALEEADKPKQS